jgi:hypothetical protein
MAAWSDDYSWAGKALPLTPLPIAVAMFGRRGSGVVWGDVHDTYDVGVGMASTPAVHPKWAGVSLAVPLVGLHRWWGLQVRDFQLFVLFAHYNTPV